ncbi:growth hormone secretagogue receptor type 1-like [Saccostrea echinata]|uniref:growth hormone secretagogue receptor type 1-like n=1 Tax=Saccostrea echinata TaxID=191078 RepID=UPI002A80F2C0|nr:growth hormone secretagogue receptor type 1-like [Saccostrea echinata]
MANASEWEKNGTHNISNSVNVPEPPQYILIIASVLYSVIFAVGFASNVSVVIVVVIARRIQSRMSALFANLSVADLMVLIVGIPSAAVDLFAKEVWYLGEFMCRFVPFVEHLVSLASVLTIVAITYDRYRGICFPLYSTCFWTKLKVKSVITGLWAIAVTASIPIAFIAVYRNSRFIDGTLIKVCRMPINILWKKVYIVGLFSIFFILMLLLLLFLVARMCRKLIWHVQFLETRTGQDADKMANGRRRVIVMLILVITTFFIFLLPQRILGIWLIFVPPSQLYKLGLEGYLNLITFTRVMLYISSAINPIIYNVLSKKFRCAFREMLPCGSKCQKNDSKSLPLMKLMSIVSVQLPPSALKRRRSASDKYNRRADIDGIKEAPHNNFKIVPQNWGNRKLSGFGRDTKALDDY